MQITDQLTALIEQQERRTTERLDRQLQRVERMQALLKRLRETEG
jgi:hypothetical protein